MSSSDGLMTVSADVSMGSLHLNLDHTQRQWQCEPLGPYAAQSFRDANRAPHFNLSTTSHSIIDEAGTGSRHMNTLQFLKGHASSNFGSEELFFSPRDSRPSSPRAMLPVSAQSTLSKCQLSRKEEHIRMRHMPAHNSFGGSLHSGSSLFPISGGAADLYGPARSFNVGSAAAASGDHLETGEGDGSSYVVDGSASSSSPWQESMGRGLAGCNPFLSRHLDDLVSMPSLCNASFMQPIGEDGVELDDDTGTTREDADSESNIGEGNTSMLALPSAEVPVMSIKDLLPHRTDTSPVTLPMAFSLSAERGMRVGPPTSLNEGGYTRKYFLQQEPTSDAVAPHLKAYGGAVLTRRCAESPTAGPRSWPTSSMLEVLDGSTTGRLGYGEGVLPRSGSEQSMSLSTSAATPTFSGVTKRDNKLNERIPERKGWQ